MRRRRAWLCLLPLIEAAVLSVCVDTGALEGRSSWWARWLAHSGDVTSVLLGAIAAGAMLVVLRGRPKRAGRRRADPAPPNVWLPLLAHLIAMAGFASLTVSLVGGSLASSPFADEWLLVWAASGAAALVGWALAVLPPQTWVRLARGGWSVAAIGLAIGAFAWVAGHATGRLWVPMRAPTFRLVQGLLQALGQDVVSRPAEFVLGTGAFHVTIDPSCSGYQGIGLIWAFLGAYLWLFRKDLRLGRALLLIPIGTVAIWLANAGRIAALILVGTWVSPAVAVGGFHSRLGWLAFIAVALGLVGVARRMPFFMAARRADGAAAKPKSRTSAYVVPLLAIVGAAMCTGAFSTGLDVLYFVRVLAAAGALWLCWRDRIGPIRVRDSISGVAVAVGVLVFGLWMALEWIAPGGADAGTRLAGGLAAMPAGWAAAWLAIRVIGAAVTVPVTEELAFRGYLLRRLIRPDFGNVDYRKLTWISFLASSALFGAMHGRWVAGTLAGMLYALAVCRRGKLADAIVAHATTNALIAAYVLATGHWALWA